MRGPSALAVRPVTTHPAGLWTEACGEEWKGGDKVPNPTYDCLGLAEQPGRRLGHGGASHLPLLASRPFLKMTCPSPMFFFKLTPFFSLTTLYFKRSRSNDCLMGSEFLLGVMKMFWQETVAVTAKHCECN